VNDDQPRCHICNRLEEFGELHGSCASCHKAFCTEHQSDFDRSICKECISIANTIITAKPLIDDEGVSHKGRHLILSGEAWMRSRDVIANMTDHELEAKLQSLKEAVHEAEMVLDYRRIIYSQTENEKSSRLSRKLSRLRLISGVGAAHKIANAVNGSKPILTKGEAHDTTRQVLSSLKGMGLNKDQIANLLMKLANQKATK
jgi:hypothetical protein